MIGVFKKHYPCLTMATVSKAQRVGYVTYLYTTTKQALAWAEWSFYLFSLGIHVTFSLTLPEIL